MEYNKNPCKHKLLFLTGCSTRALSALSVETPKNKIFISKADKGCDGIIPPITQSDGNLDKEIYPNIIHTIH